MITRAFLRELEQANEDAVLDNFPSVRHNGAAKRARMLAQIGKPDMRHFEVANLIAEERAKLPPSAADRVLEAEEGFRLTEAFLEELFQANEDSVLDNYPTVRHDGAAKRAKLLAQIGRRDAGYVETADFVDEMRAKFAEAEPEAPSGPSP